MNCLVAENSFSFMEMKRALISGITGQDGSYLAEWLLDKGYEVHGLLRRSSQFNRSRIDPLRAQGKPVHLHYADLSDQTTLRRLFFKIQPHEFYHLAGQSHVGLSFEIPESTLLETAFATLSLLEICRDMPEPPRVFHAASSELFGIPMDYPQHENTPFRPVNPYGCAKACAAHLVRVYRETHGLFAVNGILFNHESPRRGESFVTQKIAMAAARIHHGSEEILELGNIYSERDWGYAPEFVQGMWKSLQYDIADDYLFATGSATTVKDFIIESFACAEIKIEFKGSGLDEIGVDSKTGKTLIRIHPKFFRPVDSHKLIGNAHKAHTLLHWFPEVTGIKVAQALTHAALNTMKLSF
jgi:GDPmannose 4,6-dehydratase